MKTSVVVAPPPDRPVPFGAEFENARAGIPSHGRYWRKGEKQQWKRPKLIALLLI